MYAGLVERRGVFYVGNLAPCAQIGDGRADDVSTTPRAVVSYADVALVTQGRRRSRVERHNANDNRQLRLS